MKLTESQKKMLTEELLGECYHDPVWHDLRGAICPKCDEGLNGIFDLHRTFTTESDMMALYRRLHEVGKWQEFIHITFEDWDRKHVLLFAQTEGEFIAWLFCLSGEGYEERCMMVIKFMEEGNEVY